MDEQALKTLILKYYSEQPALFRLLWKHSCQVAGMACEIADRIPGKTDRTFIYEAAMLHDIGIFKTHAPSIFCTGNEPYICHGVIGCRLLQSEGLPKHALVCERHTGAGLSQEEIIAGNMPLPHRDLLPISIEERIICYADKFFSKSSPDKVKTIDDVRRDIAKFGATQLHRFESMHEQFS